jgi:hypothetical protein
MDAERGCVYSGWSGDAHVNLRVSSRRLYRAAFMEHRTQGLSE